MTDRQAGVEEVPPGYKRTEVGMIPEDWSVSLLDSIAVRGSGHTPDKKHPEYWDGSIPWISLADSPKLDNGYIYETTSTITPAGIQNSSAVIHPPETVVLTRDAGVGKSAIMGQAMAVSQHFMAWRCGPNINNHFLYYWLQSKKGEFERIAIGNTIKTIGLPYFKNLKIPLPHIHEQYTIAAALSDVDGLIGALDALIEKKRAIKQAAMQQLLTGKKRLPGFAGQWETKQLCEVADIDPENLPSNTDPTYSFNYISLEQVDTGRLMGYSEEVCSTAPSRARRVLRFGDVLMSTVRPNLMAHLHYREQIKNAVCSTGFSVLRVKRGLADPGFVFAHLFGGFVNKQIEKMLAGSNYPAISGRDVKSIEITCPPTLDEQIAIAAVLSDMDAGITALERRREKAKQIKQGMMQHLLTGKVRLVEPECKRGAALC
ncbi:Type I restriction modification DNA specificity domain protein [anaerobic digester metagenome]